MLNIGDTIQNCTVTRLIARGGMGEVFAGLDASLDRKVAIKVFARNAKDSNDIERFQREAKVLAKIDHPNVAKIYSLAEVAGSFVIIMEYIEGRTLAQILEERGRLSLPVSVAVYYNLAAGLSAIHRAGIVHRDIKPANIIIGSNGSLKIVDLGIAKELKKEDPTLTLDGGVCGTPNYMAPEQAQGQPITFASDIWALGLVLFEMLVGRRAFQGETIGEVMDRVLSEHLQVADDERLLVPEPIRQFIHKHVRKDPKERFPTLEIAVSRLTKIGQEQPSLRLPSGRQQGIPELSEDVLVDGLEFEDQSSPNINSSLKSGSLLDLISFTTSRLRRMINPQDLGKTQIVTRGTNAVEEQTHTKPPLWGKRGLLLFLKLGLYSAAAAGGYGYFTAHVHAPDQWAYLGNRALVTKAPTTMILTWPANEGLAQSTLTLARTPDFQGPLEVIDTLSDPQALDIPVEYQGTIHWKVTRKIFFGLINRSRSGSFKLETVGPPVPLAKQENYHYVIPPEQDAVVVNLDWTANPQVQAYRLQLSREPDFFRAAYDKVTTNSGAKLGMKAGVYYWRVSNSKPLSFAGIWSEPRKVTVVRSPATGPDQGASMASETQRNPAQAGQ